MSNRYTFYFLIEKVKTTLAKSRSEFLQPKSMKEPNESGSKDMDSVLESSHQLQREEKTNKD